MQPTPQTATDERHAAEPWQCDVCAGAAAGTLTECDQAGRTLRLCPYCLVGALARARTGDGPQMRIVRVRIRELSGCSPTCPACAWFRARA